MHSHVISHVMLQVLVAAIVPLRFTSLCFLQVVDRRERAWQKGEWERSDPLGTTVVMT